MDMSNRQDKNRTKTYKRPSRAAVIAAAIFTAALVFGGARRNRSVFADGKIAAIYRDGAVELNLPYSTGLAEAGSAGVEIIDAAGAAVGARVARTSGSRDRSDWRVSIPLNRAIEASDLAWYRLKVTAANKTQIWSMSQILRIPVLRIIAQQHYAAGSRAAIRVIAEDSSSGDPLPGSYITVGLAENGGASTLFAGRADRFGTDDISINLPAGEFGSRKLEVAAETEIGAVKGEQPIEIERRTRILLTTDKPIYQPSQTMHIRALAFDRETRAAQANQRFTLEVEDGKGNKVFKRQGSTDRFGIAFADFELADEVNFGNYHIRAIIGDTAAGPEAVSTEEKTVVVDRYVLPKFKIEVSLDKDQAKQQAAYFQPGDIVSGRVHAHYLFGKPITGADVTVKLVTFDVQQVELATLKGRTDPEGAFAFSSKLPDFLAGRSTEQGSAPVAITAEVKDTAAHVESKSRNILVSNTPITIMAVPESGNLLPGLDNRVFILTSYPDGAPARTVITGNIPGGRLKTDDSGVATAVIKSSGPTFTLDLKATDGQGRAATAKVDLKTLAQPESLMLRADRSIHRIGDTLRIETISTRSSGAVYIDLVQGGQTLLTRAIDTSHGRGQLAIGITPEMAGTIEIRAYQFTADADPISDRKLVYVDPADDLKVQVTADKASYEPGQDAVVSFQTTDRNGRPVSAALGVEVVDEAVFALSERQPGFEKVFMYLEDELLKPRYEVHQFSFEEVIHPLPRKEPEELVPVARERAAEVLFAAAGATDDKDVRAEFGREEVNSKWAAYFGQYWQTTYATAQQIAARMAAYYLTAPPSTDGFGRDLEIYGAKGSLPADPWGRQFTGTGTIGDGPYSMLTLKSAGPDGRPGTPDDIDIAIYAQPDRSGTATVFARFDGKITTEDAVVAGGRASIEGALRNKNGNAIAHATITARRRATGKTVRAYADDGGRFALSDLAPGLYEIEFQAPGYQTTSNNNLHLAPGTRTTIQSILSSGGGAVIRLTPYPYRLGRTLGVGGGVPMEAEGIDNLAIISKAELAPMAAEFGRARDIREKDDNVLNNKNGPASGAADREGAPDAPAQPRVRSFFPETLYTNPALITDGDGRAQVRIPLADSITTWRITSLASTTRGEMGSSAVPLTVFQNFFVDLDLPVSITQGDSVSVPVAIYNYLPDSHRVSVELRRDPWFDLENDGAQKQIDVAGNSVGVVYFRLHASKIGDQQLLVTARIDGAGAAEPGDAVARPITVVPNGQEQDVVLNDRLEGTANQQVTIPDNAIADASKILVRVYPGPLSQMVDGLDSILRMPGGCFEQTSSSTYPDVLVMDYLKTSKKITPEIQAKAEGFVSLGYQRLVTFEVPGGGFSWFGQAPANKILTAYGLMEFSDMSRVHDVDPKLIQRTQAWLASQQQPDGSFKPDANFINEGATNHYTSDVLRITAYIGWSLAATGYSGDAVERARNYCQSHASGREDAYTLAVLANFAADYGKDGEWTARAIAALAAKAVDNGKTAYWKLEGETPTYARAESASLETTALAVQALLKSGLNSALAKKGLDYLTEKKDALGNWETTQATILSLKAFLLSFTKGAADSEGTVEVAVDGKSVAKFSIDRNNNDVAHQIDLKSYTHSGTNQVALNFSGKGSLQYQIVGRYYTPWAVKPREDGGAALAIQVNYDRTHLAQDETATARVSVRNNTRAVAEMIMVDLGIPPGFEPSADDFEALMKPAGGAPGGRLQKYTITAKQIILYFDALTPGQHLEFSYKLRAKFPLRAQSFSSRVYEYYNPEVEATTKPTEFTVTSK